MLFGGLESIHVVLSGVDVEDLLEIRVWSEEGHIAEPTCKSSDCMFVLDLEGVMWGMEFAIGAEADVMQDGDPVTIAAPSVDVEMISP